jgi:hypothetical protein
MHFGNLSYKKRNLWFVSQDRLHSQDDLQKEPCGFDHISNPEIYEWKQPECKEA